MRGISKQQRIAIRRRTRHQLGADDAARARTIVDHHLLPQHLRQAAGGDARHDVGRAAYGDRHDQADWALGIGGGLRKDEARRQAGEPTNHHHM